MALFEIEKQRSNDWKWTFSDYPISDGTKVFSCFSCAGGSTMGYKLAGCEVLGNLEIDKKMNDIYISNHKPKFNFCMDIREFNRLPTNEVPKELFDLDILDGSPPCTTFSMSGNREKDWGRARKFSEGQAVQTLDDLSFVFIDTVKKLKPKMVIIENVTGLSYGNAWEQYFVKIYNKLFSIGYNTRCYEMRAENMGVPQTRHRLFFVGTLDKTFNFNGLDMSFNYEPVPLCEIRSGVGKKLTDYGINLFNRRNSYERKWGQTINRLTGEHKCWNQRWCFNDEVLPTITTRAFNNYVDVETGKRLSDSTILNAQTFPQDFDFCNQNVSYVCGMSVPPLMIKRIVGRIKQAGMI